MNNPYAELAAQLRAIADDLAGLDSTGVPGMSATVYLQPDDHDLPDGQQTAAVDVVATALLGVTAETRQLSGGAWHHTVSSVRGGISVSVFCQVADPEQQDLRAENERLRAQLDELGGSGGAR